MTTAALTITPIATLTIGARSEYTISAYTVVHGATRYRMIGPKGAEYALWETSTPGLHSTRLKFRGQPVWVSIFGDLAEAHIGRRPTT